MIDRFPLGYNTYSIRALRWHDLQLLNYAAEQKLDAVFLQDSIDPANNDPAHWKELKETAARLGLVLHGGDAGALPRTPDGMPATLQRLREGVRHAAGIGSKLVRFRVAGDRASLPPGPPEKHIEDSIRVLRAVRTRSDGRRREIRHRESQGDLLLANPPGHRRRGQGIRRLLSRHRQSGVRHGGPAGDGRNARPRRGDAASARFSGV